MKDLELLLKAKREEPTTVSIEVIDSWLKGGFVLVGLFATLKRLFTQKMWLMFTSISSITLVTILTFSHFSRPQADTFKKDKLEKTPVQILESKQVNPTVLALNEIEVPIMHNKEVLTKMPQAIPNLRAQNTDLKLLEPKQNTAPQQMATNDTTKYFDRIDVNGSISFTLVNGPACSVSNLLKDGIEAESFNYTIKNGILFLDGVPENDAPVLVITVPN